MLVIRRGSGHYKLHPMSAFMMYLPPNGIIVPWWDRGNSFWEAVMSEIATIGLNLAKNVFQLDSPIKRNRCSGRTSGLTAHGIS